MPISSFSSMSNLILHIGSEKTGTTAIQYFLRENQALLEAAGLFVPEFLATQEGNHRWLPFLVYEPSRSDDWIILKGLQEADVRDQQKAAVLQQLHEHVAATGHLTWIISSEHLQSRLTTAEEVQALHDLLSPLFEEITVVVYLREQLQSTLSFWSTAVRTGSSIVTLPAPGEIGSYNCNHQDILQRWQAVFGRDAIRVRLFGQQYFVNNNLIDDFLAAAQIPSDQPYRLPTLHNQSLSYQAIKLLSKINLELPLFIGNTLNPVRADLHSFFDHGFAGFPRYIPTQQEWDHYSDYYRESNEWVAANYCPTASRLWSQCPYTLREHEDTRFDPVLTIKDEAFIQFVLNVWRTKQSQIIRLKQRLGT
jgi:hypothetical protein